MKKFILFIMLVLSSGFVFAEENEALEAVQLNVDDEVQSINLEKQKINTDKFEFLPYRDTDNYNDIKKYDDADLYSKKTSTFKKEKKINDKTTVGAKYDTSFNPDSINQTRTLYSKYDVTEKFSVNTLYKNNTMNGLTEQTKGSVAVEPEYKINKHFSLKNIFGRNVGDKSNNAGVQFNMQPFQDDRMDLNVGASQVQRDNNGATSSQVNFGTNIRF